MRTATRALREHSPSRRRTSRSRSRSRSPPPPTWYEVSAAVRAECRRLRMSPRISICDRDPTSLIFTIGDVTATLHVHVTAASAAAAAAAATAAPPAESKTTTLRKRPRGRSPPTPERIAVQAEARWGHLPQWVPLLPPTRTITLTHTSWMELRAHIMRYECASWSVEWGDLVCNDDGLFQHLRFVPPACLQDLMCETRVISLPVKV